METMQYREMHALVVSFLFEKFPLFSCFENFQSFTKVIEIFFLMFSIFFLKKKMVVCNYFHSRFLCNLFLLSLCHFRNASL